MTLSLKLYGKLLNRLTMPWHSSSINSCHERAKWKMQKKKKKVGGWQERKRDREIEMKQQRGSKKKPGWYPTEAFPMCL